MDNKPKLSLRKETITKLNDEQLKKFIGGKKAIDQNELSCTNDSCNSQVNTGTCGDHSCNC